MDRVEEEDDDDENDGGERVQQHATDVASCETSVGKDEGGPEDSIGSARPPPPPPPPPPPGPIRIMTHAAPHYYNGFSTNCAMVGAVAAAVVVAVDAANAASGVFGKRVANWVSDGGGGWCGVRLCGDVWGRE